MSPVAKPEKRKGTTGKTAARTPSAATRPSSVTNGGLLAEALEQQRATTEILRIISRSRSDVQPVFDIIAERSVKLCNADVSVVSRVDGELIRLAALYGVKQVGVKAIGRAFPMRLAANTNTVSTATTALRTPGVWPSVSWPSKPGQPVK